MLEIKKEMITKIYFSEENNKCLVDKHLLELVFEENNCSFNDLTEINGLSNNNKITMIEIAALMSYCVFCGLELEFYILYEIIEKLNKIYGKNNLTDIIKISALKTLNQNSNQREESYYKAIGSFLCKKIRNSKVIKHKNDTGFQPDIWLEIKNSEFSPSRKKGQLSFSNKKTKFLLPVEVKKGKFDEKALRQLNRYINHYDCQRGIAVSSELTVSIPKNIQHFCYEF